MPRSPYASIYERLVANTHEPENARDCWRWARRLDRGGYGIIDVHVPGLGRNATLKAHLLLYVWMQTGEREADDLFLAYKEQAISGLELDHLCGEQWCCNPDHLELVTASENSQRRGRR
jgi:hypothetical protein